MKIPSSPPTITEWLNPHGESATYTDRSSKILSLLSSDLGKDRDGEYLHWDKLKYKPLPEGIQSHEEWWILTKLRRGSFFRSVPLEAKNNQLFKYWIPDPVQQKLHLLDQQASGRIESSERVISSRGRDQYLVNSLVEEAITSSQLEGASTTRKIAKEMLREGRKPTDKSERMIYNNYQAMSFVREIANEKLTPELVLELHKIITRGTLEDPNTEGRLRQPDEDIGVYDNRSNELLHQPPHADSLNERLKSLCEFANHTNSSPEFLHPVVRSIILHFMIGFDHPFCDGNGRTARALFYWSMVRHGYWLMEYVSISSIVKSAPAKYVRAYLFTETDEDDLTYFIDYNLEVITKAVDKLQKHLSSKAEQIHRIESLLGSNMISKSLNARQIAILSRAVRNPGSLFTIESHKNSHNITYPTARSDLMALMNLDLLEKKKIKRAFIFRAYDDIEERLAKLEL